MSVTLFDNAILSDIDDLEEQDTSVSEASLEALAVSPTVVDQDQIVTNADPIAQQKDAAQKILLQYTSTPLPSKTGKLVTFYLNIQDISSRIINQFAIMSDILVKPTDVLFVHLSSILEIDNSHIVYNAIKMSPAKAKIACIPYSLNTAAFYPALACSYIIPCKFGRAVFESCSVRAGGAGHLDAKNAYEFDLGRKVQLLKAVSAQGFLPEDKLKHILEEQGSFSLHGEAFYNAVMQYNKNQAGKK
jgi:hypothetical protein